MAEIALIPVVAAVVLFALGRWWTGPQPKGLPIDAEEDLRTGIRLLMDVGNANAEVFDRRRRELHMPYFR